VTATAKLTGPVTGGSRGWAFGAAAFDLAALGYVEEEFFFEGEATCYRHVEGTVRSFDGHWEAEAARSVPYKSRMLVRRPADASRFNGTTIVFWTNVSLGFEILTGETPELYNGFAMVGVLAQRVAIDGFPEGPRHGLVTWDPARYGTLSIPTDDASYDIFTQAVNLVGPTRTPQVGDPLGGLPSTNVVAFGASQSAVRLATYLNAVQPLEGALDGFLLDVYFGNGTALEAIDPAAGPRSVAQIKSSVQSGGLRPGSHLLRDDMVPVFVLNSETEAILHYPVRQADTAKYRFWELAGHAHGTVPATEGLLSSWERDLGLRSHPLAPASGYNTLDLSFARSAALRHMHRWVRSEADPPRFPRIDIDGDHPQIRRDDLGNACGGIRMPDFDVPTGTHTGFASDGSMSLFGSSTPFAAAVLRGLYGHHDAYWSRVEGSAISAVDQGVLLGDQAPTLLARAATAPDF
jgi:hypothetical protein